MAPWGGVVKKLIDDTAQIFVHRASNDTLQRARCSHDSQLSFKSSLAPPRPLGAEIRPYTGVRWRRRVVS